MPMRFKLDFNLETSQERLQYLKDTVDFTQLTKKDIETCTDYVLYGKDPEKNKLRGLGLGEMRGYSRQGYVEKNTP